MDVIDEGLGDSVVLKSMCQSKIRSFCLSWHNHDSLFSSFFFVFSISSSYYAGQ